MQNTSLINIVPSRGNKLKMKIIRPALQALFVFILLISEIAVFLPVRVEAAPVVMGNEVSISLDEAYISATPATLTASGWVEVTFWTRNYEGPVDVVYGFNGLDNVKAVNSESWEAYNHTKTRQVEATDNKSKKTETYTEAYPDWNRKTISTTTMSHAGANQWDVAPHKSVAKNDIQKTRVWIDIPFNGTGKVKGKYNIGIKPSNLTLDQAKLQGKLWLLDPWYNVSWDYRKSLIIDQTDDLGPDVPYPMKITIHYGGADVDDVESTTQALAIVHTPGATVTDFDDLRFTKSDGATLLDYWIESKTDGVSAIVWIETVLLDDAADTTIYMYYGNAAAAAATSGANTFLQYHGAATATFLDAAVTGTTGGVRFKASAKVPADGSNVLFGMADAAANTDESIHIQFYSNFNLRYAGAYHNGAGTTQNENPTLADNTFHLIEGLLLFGTSYKGYDGTNQIGADIVATLPDESLGLFMWEAGGNGEQEWSFISKYTTNEPTWGLFGTVENEGCTLTGTITTVTDIDIIAGGETIILTLGGDTWVAAGAVFDAQRQNIIDGMTSAGAEAHGWNNEVRDKIPVTDVVRTSDAVVTITLSAEAGYIITASETITVTVPATALVGGAPLVAAPTFTVTKTPPTVTTGICSGSGTTWAVLNGNVTYAGIGLTQRGFDYGLTTAYGSSSVDTGTYAAGTYYKSLTGLLPSTIYHYRAKTFNGVWAYGADAIFATKGSPAITTYLNTGDDSCSFIYGTIVGAQTFTTSATTEYSVTSVRVLLNKTLVPGDVTVSLRRTAGGVPTGVDLASGTIDDALISTSYTWYDVTMSTEVTLELNTMYAILVSAPNGDITNYICWRYAAAGGLANGNAVVSDDSGITWDSSPRRMCGLGSSLSSAPYDDDAWVDPTNIYSNNAAYASVTAATYDTNDYTEVLKATTFGLSVPTTATITGILVEVKKYCGAGAAKDGVIQLTKDGAARVGASAATATAWPAAAAILSYGGVADLWGTTWTPAEVNAATFGVHVAAQATADDTDVYVDFVRITVYYSYDYMFELWGNQALEIQDAKVFKTYKETGDWIVTVRYIDTFAPYYDTYDVKQYFTLQLVNAAGTALASTAVPAWGNRVGSIYLSTDAVTSLTWGGDYRVRIYGTFTGNPYTEYALVAADWVGDDLSRLDSWVFTSADTIGTYYSTTLTTYVAERGQVLNAGGSGIFNACIGGLSQVRPGIFQIYSNPSVYTPATIGQTYRHAIDQWQTNIGPDGTVMLNNLGKIIGVEGDIISVIAFLGMVVLLMTLAFPAGATPAACALSLPLLGAAIWFGMDWIYIGMLGIVSAFLFVKNLWIDKGT